MGKTWKDNDIYNISIWTSSVVYTIGFQCCYWFVRPYINQTAKQLQNQGGQGSWWRSWAPLPVVWPGPPFWFWWFQQRQGCHTYPLAKYDPSWYEYPSSFGQPYVWHLSRQQSDASSCHSESNLRREWLSWLDLSKVRSKIRSGRSTQWNAGDFKVWKIILAKSLYRLFWAARTTSSGQAP